ncbi:hypothetical protein MLD38_034624 [Melastoma candidum]|uniref:Uncharacterized protein n=1 Tax=Melastoma candidum TaxID=119954 RepID=A0ACB9MAJ8_9MYRT|nr:hypothetical protein MLD38_034624 [Melastoma candidum]
MDEGCPEAASFTDDWEVLAVCPDSPPSSSSVLALDEASIGGGLIKVDYFAAHGSGFLSSGGDVSESGDSVASDKPSWIDPSSDNGRYGKGSTEPWSDESGSSDGVPEERAKGEVDLYESMERVVGYGGICADVKAKGEVSLYDSVRSEIVKFEDEVVMGCGDGGEVGRGGGGGDDDGVGMKVDEEKAEDESRRGRVVWWKVPLELVRYYAMRMGNPVWTFSVAAAILGVVMLGRKLYKMRQKTRAMPLKVTVDDKKVSQFMNRVARLNEAFSVVRHVPIIRPVLPGVSQLPVMSMR